MKQYAILLVRVSLGTGIGKHLEPLSALFEVFFAISGPDKLFVAGSRQTVYEALVEAKVPFPHLMTYFVSGVEFVGGFFADSGLSFEPGPLGFIGRYACRHPDDARKDSNQTLDFDEV